MKASGGKEQLGNTIYQFCETEELVDEGLEPLYIFIDIIQNRKNEKTNFHFVKF